MSPCWSIDGGRDRDLALRKGEERDGSSNPPVLEIPNFPRVSLWDQFGKKSFLDNLSICHPRLFNTSRDEI